MRAYLANLFFGRYLIEERVRCYWLGAEHVRETAYPLVANCSLSAHKKALAILRPTFPRNAGQARE